jgi:diguanylate cyclase
VFYLHNSEKARNFANSAMQRIQSLSLTPTPEIFELWYVYHAGDNTDVIRAVDAVLANGSILNDDSCRDLHEKFLSDSRENERVRKAGDRIQATIREVNGVVSDVKDATSKYNASLADVSETLSRNESKAQIEAVLKKALNNTQDMMRHNQLLEQELSKSSLVMKELQRDLDLVRKEALTDGLTGLANRKAFDAEIRRFAEEAQNTGTGFTLALLDIDHFKSFNDNYGHQVGDQVLRLVARTLIEGVKGRDLASRFGGEEFAIILPDTEIPSGIRVADALRRAVAGKEVVNRNNNEKLGRITLSGGVAQYIPGERIDDLIARADAGLYTAKHNGRNQIASAPAPGQKKSA